LTLNIPMVKVNKTHNGVPHPHYVTTSVDLTEKYEELKQKFLNKTKTIKNTFYFTLMVGGFFLVPTP
jgi:hypothetical protein